MQRRIGDPHHDGSTHACTYRRDNEGGTVADDPGEDGLDDWEPRLHRPSARWKQFRSYGWTDQKQNMIQTSLHNKHAYLFDDELHYKTSGSLDSLLYQVDVEITDLLLLKYSLLTWSFIDISYVRHD